MTRRIAAALLALIPLLALATPGPAAAGTFTVESCQGAPGFSTAAFENFATRGMVTKRACRPRGPGLRGMTVSVKAKKGRVKRGSTARFVMTAPPGTAIVRAAWSGTRVRSDCGFTLDVYAQGGKTVWPFGKTRTAGKNCPRPGRSQTADVDGGSRANISATRMVQRVICARKACSARGRNYLKTSRMTVTLADLAPPTVAITGGSLVAGGLGPGQRARRSPTQRGTTSASERLVTSARRGAGSRLRPAMPIRDRHALCSYPSIRGWSLIRGWPPRARRRCGPRRSTHPATRAFPEPRVIHVDRTPPARVDAAVDGGEGWRASPSFAIGWANPAEPDRAPITAATYRLCPSGSSSGCVTNRVAGDGIARLAVQPPQPGEWVLRAWREDAAGNQDESQASAPVVLRYDPTPPQLSFAAASAADPTRIAVDAVDDVSGVASGTIELSREGSGTWQAIPATLEGRQLIGQVDDATLPPGNYQLRARASDQAGNERSIAGRTLTLPLRTATTMRAGAKKTKLVRRRVGKRGKRRTVRRRVTVLEPSGRVRFGGRTTLAGRLTDRDGNGIAGDVAVYEESEVAPRRLLGTIRSTARGAFSYRARGTQSRTLTFVYQGTRVILPVSRQVRLVVPASSTMRSSRRRLLNGQRVTFSGRVRSKPIPATGKLIAIQVRLYSGRRARWSTFRTTRSDTTGRWAVPYRFSNTCERLKRWRLRAVLPREAGSPFGTGRSTAIRVKVRGNGRC